MSETIGVMKPLYQKIYSEIKQTIINGTLSQSEKLPSENELCRIYNVSRITIRKALDLLTEEGWVVKIQGKGSFANPDAKVRSKIVGPSSFSDFASAQGSTHKSIILKREIVRDKNISEKLSVNQSEDLLFIKRVLTLNDEPLMIDQAWLPAKFFPNLLTEVSEKMSLYKTLATRYNTLVEHSHKELNVSLPNNEQQELLHITATTPIFIVNKVAANQSDIPIEISEMIVRGDKMTYLISDPVQGQFKFNESNN